MSRFGGTWVRVRRPSPDGRRTPPVERLAYVLPAVICRKVVPVPRDGLADLRNKLRVLFREASGDPQRQLSQAALVETAQRVGLPLPKQSLSELLQGPATNRWATIEAFILACAVARSKLEVLPTGDQREELLRPYREDYERATGRNVGVGSSSSKRAGARNGSGGEGQTTAWPLPPVGLIPSLAAAFQYRKGLREKVQAALAGASGIILNQVLMRLRLGPPRSVLALAG